MHTRFRSIQGLLLAAVFALATPFLCAAQLESPADLQWIRVNDERLQWLNVSDWEPRGDGLQPVRVPKVWRDKWPARTASRAQSAAGVTARFRTDSKKLVFRVTFVDVADTPGTPEATWERSRPSYLTSIETISTSRVLPLQLNLPSKTLPSIMIPNFPARRRSQFYFHFIIATPS